ncbi:MAG: translation initiation factor IF-2 [Desulfobacteraceae bacterium]|nr:translation initiation factor IF-2 [Desulfobacteraceae bacterium]MBC2719736.1 translation initiation factor IF-2 [Desulfobacteraceae bacterium]
MGKIRIYELARELNIKNKELLEKLSKMAIKVSSHMSSLDDEAVARVKASLHGSNKTDAVEVTRIKPTVIRRRKKIVLAETAPEKEVPLKKVSPPEKITTDEQPSVKAIEEKALIAEPELKEAEKPKKVKKKDAEKGMAEKPALEKDEKTDEAVRKTAFVEVEKKPKQPPVAKKAETETFPKGKKPKKVKKKLKKEMPAKIIKMPIPHEEKLPENEQPQVKKIKIKVEEPPEIEKKGPTGKNVQTDLSSKEKKKRKKDKKIEEPVSDKKFFKKKISFRKKEVVEGADLYQKQHRGRKIRKAAAKSKTAVQGKKPQITIPKAIKRRIKIDDAIVLADLAKRMGIKANEMIKTIMDMGVIATVNQTIDFDTASLIATECNYEVEKASFEEEVILKVEKDDPDKLIGRPPVVTIMGHVDHGKTSLLDVIRKTKVTEIEAGGITQHIGAYFVSTDKGQIVFLDTPGHEAFTAMRARGAKVTDIVVLVVAADDGVMPQTVEAINHSKVAGVPIIVAINKIDKANADPERVKREIAELGLAPEEWGGDTIFVNVSAKINQGIEELLEMILLQAELMELKANPDKFAQGNVVEAKIDSGRGAVATLLIQEGTLHTGDAIVCGIHHGKVRAMLNDRGKHVGAAGPSIPVEILGLTGVPNAGDEFIALADDKSAKQVSIHRIQKQRAKDLSKTSRLSLEKLFEQMEEGETKKLNLIIKADVHGSTEALRDSLIKLSNNEIDINVIHAATGTIIESDVSLAAVSDAIIIGFNVRPSTKVEAFANEENVDMRFYNIIYHVIKDIKNAIIGMMESTYEERILGKAEVREVFHVPKIGTIAGCYVTDGKIERGKLVRLIRDGIVSYEGKISSLRRFKEDAKEVQSGYECGIGIENFNDIKLGDIIECYYLEEIKPEIEE